MKTVIYSKSLLALTVLSALSLGACTGTGKQQTALAPEVTPVYVENTAPAVENDTVTLPVAATVEMLEKDEEIAAEMTALPEQNILFFSFDDSSIRIEDHDMLRSHAEYLQSNPDKTLQISGHTDSYGDPIYNRYLGKKRADEVAQMLVDFGVNKAQLQVSGYADEKPFDHASHQRQHRRVELQYSDMSLAKSE